MVSTAADPEIQIMMGWWPIFLSPFARLPLPLLWNSAKESKGPFIVTQLNSTLSWIASAGRYRHFADATQLDVEWTWV